MNEFKKKVTIISIIFTLVFVLGTFIGYQFEDSPKTSDNIIENVESDEDSSAVIENDEVVTFIMGRRTYLFMICIGIAAIILAIGIIIVNKKRLVI